MSKPVHFKSVQTFGVLFEQGLIQNTMIMSVVIKDSVTQFNSGAHQCVVCGQDGALWYKGIIYFML